MFTATLALTANLLWVQTVSTSEPLDILPTDDVWVYPHAGDPSKDGYLRLWGNGSSMPQAGDDEQNFSYSFLRFDLSKVDLTQFKVAKLILTHVGNAPFDEKVAKDNPVEVRRMTADFTEKSWSYDRLSSVRPVAGKDGLIASGFPKNFKGELPFEVTIDLALTPEKLKDAIKLGPDKTFGVALTSSLDPASSDPRAMYKFYSKDGEAKYRPFLRLIAEGK